MTRQIAMLIALVVLVAILVFAGPAACQKIRSLGAQGRVSEGQAGAAQESTKDAINAVAASGERESASEELTRNNDKDIRAADGANQRIPTGVDVAGRKALCRRAAYANDPKCKAVRP